MKDMISRALELRRKGGITKDERGAFYVPSSDGKRLYVVSESHVCNCPALSSVCYHKLATTYLDALLAIQLMRYAESEEWLQAVVEEYSDRVEVLPLKIRALVKAEYLEAKQRLQPAEQKAA